MLTRTRRRLRTPSAGAAMVIALVLAAPGGAAAAPSQDACSPSKEMVDAMVSQFGLTQQQARDRIRAECRSPGILDAARQAAGEAYGGAFFDPGSNNLIVGVTDPAVFDAVRAAGAEPRLVATSYAALGQDLHVLDSRTNTEPPEVTGWRIDDTTNSVIVDVAGGPSQAVKTFMAGLDHTQVHYNQPQVHPTAELIGGTLIIESTSTGIYHCTLGFSASNSSGLVYALTAGHCTQTSGQWQGGPNNTTIGPSDGYRYPGDDYGRIRVGFGWLPTSKIQGGPSVLGSTQATVGSTVCKSGAGSGYTCGVIQAQNQTVNYGSSGTVFGMTRTNVCAWSRDSGAPFISSSRQAQGILSGSTQNDYVCGSLENTYYQPVNEALTAWGLTLVTG
jgi:streptogrisin C